MSHRRWALTIHVDVMRVPFEKLASLGGREPSATIRARVDAARKIQAARFATVDKPYVLVNGDMGPAEVQQFCQIDDAGKSLMGMAVRQMDLNTQSYHRVLKLGRSIADLAGVEAIAVEHLAEALQYRPRGIV